MSWATTLGSAPGPLWSLPLRFCRALSTLHTSTADRSHKTLYPCAFGNLSFLSHSSSFFFMYLFLFSTWGATPPLWIVLHGRMHTHHEKERKYDCSYIHIQTSTCKSRFSSILLFHPFFYVDYLTLRDTKNHGNDFIYFKYSFLVRNIQWNIC